MTMTIQPSDFPNSHGQMVKINRYFNNFNKKIWNFRDCNDKIWIDHFDHEDFVILGMVMVKIGLTILTIEPQFWPNGQKIVVIGPPPPLISVLVVITSLSCTILDVRIFSCLHSQLGPV
jgi:hypothetical protein